MNIKQNTADKARENMHAVLCGLVQGIALNEFREKLSGLPALSEYSKYRIGDVVAELESAGKIQFDDNSKIMRLIDDNLIQHAKMFEADGLSRLRTLGVCFS